MNRRTRSRLLACLALFALVLLPSCTWFMDEFSYSEPPAPTLDEIEAASLDR